MVNKAAIIRDLMRKLNKLLNATVSKELSRYGLTMPQVLVMKEVICESRTIGQISKALQLSYSTVSGIIDRLERDGYVTRVKDQEDRRVIWIQKTPKIDENFSRLTMFQEAFYSEMLESISEDEIDSFMKTLEIFFTHLEKKAEEKP